MTWNARSRDVLPSRHSPEYEMAAKAISSFQLAAANVTSASIHVKHKHVPCPGTDVGCNLQALDVKADLERAVEVLQDEACHPGGCGEDRQGRMCQRPPSCLLMLRNCTPQTPSPSADLKHGHSVRCKQDWQRRFNTGPPSSYRLCICRAETALTFHAIADVLQSTGLPAHPAAATGQPGCALPWRMPRCPVGSRAPCTCSPPL